MSEEHSSQIPSQAYGIHPAGDITQLVRRAMTVFESDRAAAWRCLNEASILLAKESDEPHVDWPGAIGAPQRGGLPKWRTKRVLEYIEEHLGSKITVGELANFVALSKNHFSRAFKQSLGSGLMTYVAMRRVERAKLMMISSRKRLGDIALVCGFADQSHLNRYFRRVVGISPGSWRRGVAAPHLRAPRVEFASISAQARSRS